MAKSISATIRPGARDGFYEMVSNAPILPHSEVFNTYGEDLTNAQLLVRYGFALDNNENDCITWDWGDLRTFAATVQDNEPSDTESSGRRLRSVDDVMQLYTRAINLWPSGGPAWDETGLVYNPTTGKKDGIGGSAQRFTERAPHDVVLCLNGDGRISHQLWLYCAVLGHQHVMPNTTDGGVEEIVRQLQEVASLLMRFEKEMSLEGSSTDGSDRDSGADQRGGRGSRQLLCTPRTPILEVASQTIRLSRCAYF